MLREVKPEDQNRSFSTKGQVRGGGAGEIQSPPVSKPQGRPRRGLEGGQALRS